MGGRYVAITGVQLGTLKGLVKTGQTEEALILIDGILENQYIGETQNDIIDDVKELSKHDIFYPDEKHG
jgi:hypothetical protein